MSAIIKSWIAFDEFVHLLRKPSNTHKSLLHLVKTGFELQQLLRETFPEKSGQAQAWNFIKFHLLAKFHLVIAMFGSAEGVNTQATERAHINFIKRLARLVNSHDVEMQVMMHHRRYSSALLGIDLISRDEQDYEQASDDEGCDQDRRRHPVFGFPWSDAIINPSAYRREMCCPIRDPGGKSHKHIPVALLLDRMSWLCSSHNGLAECARLIAEYIYSRYGDEVACLPFSPVSIRASIPTLLHMHTLLHTCIHTYMHAYMHTCFHRYVHALHTLHVCTYIHAYNIHTYIHTYIHTCIHAHLLSYVLTLHTLHVRVT